MKKLIITTSLLTFLTGCGGSNSNPPAQTVNPTSPSTPDNAVNIIQQVNGFDFYGDETPMVGQNSGLGIHNPTAAKLVDIKWQQTSGANLDLIADHTNVIGFTPSAPGTYSC